MKNEMATQINKPFSKPRTPWNTIFCQLKASRVTPTWHRGSASAGSWRPRRCSASAASGWSWTCGGWCWPCAQSLWARWVVCETAPSAGSSHGWWTHCTPGCTDETGFIKRRTITASHRKKPKRGWNWILERLHLRWEAWALARAVLTVCCNKRRLN